jgi:hypothetical protein
MAIVLLVPSPVVPTIASEIGNAGVPSSPRDLSAVPQNIAKDAARLATEVCGNYQEIHDDFIAQLLNTYLAAKDKDVVMIFNSGGWGWTPVEATTEGQSFIAGIESELASSGYSSLMLDFRRTAKNANGIISEAMLVLGLYPAKAKDLAARVEFLTRHLPDTKVILAGVSNGTIICDNVMSILGDMPHVYSIQMGPPFWGDSRVSDRSLVVRSNGVVPDSFSDGDLFTIIRANLETLLGIPQGDPGNILLYIGAPGHDYQWHHPEVHSQVIDFLQRQFGLKPC